MTTDASKPSSEYADLSAAHIARNAEPDPARPRFIRDTHLPGFALKVAPSGLKTWVVEARVRGQKHAKRRSIGRYPALTPEKARRLAIQELGRFAEGTDRLTDERTARAKTVTLGRVVEDYLAFRDLKPVTVADYRRAFAGYADWEDKQITAITRSMVELRHKKLGQRSRARANISMRLLRALFNFAIGKYEDGDGEPIVVDNPIQRLSATRAWYRVERRRRLIRQHDLPAWFDAVEALQGKDALAPVVGDWLEFLLLTGCRRTEALTLRWADVNLAGRFFTIPDPKNRQPHELPFTDRIEVLLERRRAVRVNDSPFVFSGESRRGEHRHLVNEKHWQRWVIEQSGVEFTPHDLRRTFATVAESLDIAGYTLKRLMNHVSGASGDVTAGYLQIDVERLRVPMQRITDAILTHARRRGQPASVTPIRDAG